ncbi:ATP synthase F(0) complex subunit f, mitochondrial-like [Petromyzon marinus]|uniref:ATP synthase membrane subunit f n=1 Tax=Petromyzon marinus TaxID=7757 RepID=S4RJI3_PETMA|nr:ATP synthase subunit f, mitochondrial-like [Petromyzon marinus]
MAAKSVALAERRLLDVKLGELPAWVGTCDLTPNGFIRGVRRGYDRYMNKYINVRRGGLGGVTMFVVGYITLSYIFSFDHVKHDRWRKYH